jgi:hypothetical protein
MEFVRHRAGCSAGAGYCDAAIKRGFRRFLSLKN